MNFANLSVPSVLAGMAALATALYFLQRLRIRFREVDVATTMFWKEALHESPVRTFRQRFRHVWAYLFFLLICLLMWLAIAEPRLENDDSNVFHVLLLDGSAGMAREGRFDAVVSELKQGLAKLPPDQRQVIWCGASTRTLLAAGEHDMLIDARLGQLRPEAVPASIERELLQLSAIQRGKESTRVHVYGDAPVSRQLLSALPEDFHVQRDSAAAQVVAGNVGVTALGVSEAASGEWDRLDLLFRIEGDEALLPAPGELRVAVDGQRVDPAAIAVDSDGSTYRVDDLDASGKLLTVEIAVADGLMLDNKASIRLPARQKIRVQLSPSLAPGLTSVLRADNAVQLVSDKPDVVIRTAGEHLGDKTPALEFVPAKLQTQAFRIVLPQPSAGDRGQQERFASAVRQIGLANIDATALADVAQKPIEVSLDSGEQWMLSVWAELLQPEYNFTGSRAFPLFVAHAVRWLAGIEQWYPYAVAGRPLPGAFQAAGFDAPVFFDAQGNRIDTLGAEFSPERAGRLSRGQNAGDIYVNYLDRQTTLAEGDNALFQGSVDASGLLAGNRILMWFPLLALLLLLVEWFLYQKGRLP